MKIALTVKQSSAVKIWGNVEKNRMILGELAHSLLDVGDTIPKSRGCCSERANEADLDYCD